MAFNVSPTQPLESVIMPTTFKDEKTSTSTRRLAYPWARSLNSTPQNEVPRPRQQIVTVHADMKGTRRCLRAVMKTLHTTQISEA